MLTLGITSIVVSLLGCVCCALVLPISFGLSIPAWVLGHSDLKAIAQGRRSSINKGVLQAGMICGIVGVALSTLAVIASIARLVLQIGAMNIR